MTKRDRERIWRILIDRDCDSPDLALRDIAHVLDRAVENRVEPLKETIAHLRRENRYLVTGES
jgi:hypothetical protein